MTLHQGSDGTDARRPSGAPYAPFLDPRLARPPGLSPLDPADWLCCDPDYAAQIRERDRLLAGRPADAMAALPEADAAVAELRETLLAWVSERPEWRVGARAVRRPDGADIPADLPTLTLAGRLCQEDLLLMAPPAAAGGEYRLVAGVLCFPSRWALADKIGRPMTAIHAPVPYYDETLARRVNRVFDGVAVARPMVRFNWTPQPTDRLDLIQREGEKRAAEDAGRGWFLRTERQTLRRLPRSRAVVFGVKTTVTAFDALTAAQRAGLRKALDAWDQDEIAYHGGATPWRAALRALEG
jgi:hypothetical protein